MSIASDNRAKYLKPPTFQEIEIFREKLGVRPATFEKFFALGRGSYHKYKMGEENLPARLWSVVYEKTMPQYVTGIIPSGKKKAKLTGKKSGKRTKKAPSAILNKLNELK